MYEVNRNTPYDICSLARAHPAKLCFARLASQALPKIIAQVEVAVYKFLKAIGRALELEYRIRRVYFGRCIDIFTIYSFFFLFSFYYLPFLAHPVRRTR